MEHALIYCIDGSPEIVNGDADPEKLLAQALEQPWEDGCRDGACCQIIRSDGLLWAAVTVVLIYGECDGTLEIYRPGEPPYRVRVRYVLTPEGKYHHTEAMRTDGVAVAA